MRKVVKTASVFILALIMAISSLVVTAAEVDTSSDSKDTTVVIYEDGDSTRAYELVWKYKYEYGHVYRRRWNATLGGWYDPDWILVY